MILCSFGGFWVIRRSWRSAQQQLLDFTIGTNRHGIPCPCALRPRASYFVECWSSLAILSWSFEVNFEDDGVVVLLSFPRSPEHVIMYEYEYDMADEKSLFQIVHHGTFICNESYHSTLLSFPLMWLVFFFFFFLWLHLMYRLTSRKSFQALCFETLNQQPRKNAQTQLNFHKIRTFKVGRICSEFHTFRFLPLSWRNAKKTYD